MMEGKQQNIQNASARKKNDKQYEERAKWRADYEGPVHLCVRFCIHNFMISKEISDSFVWMKHISTRLFHMEGQTSEWRSVEYLREDKFKTDCTNDT